MNTEIKDLMASIDSRLARMEEMAAIGIKTMLTVREAALYLGISEDRVRHLMSQGALSYHKGSGTSRSYLAKTDLDAYLTGVKYRSHAEIQEEADRRHAAHLRSQRERRQASKAMANRP